MANACRDLVLENGPDGLKHDEIGVGKAALQRSQIHLSSQTGLKETVVYTNYGNVLNEDRSGWEVFQKMMENKNERVNLFNSGFTHVGISCGCHATEVEMCCF